ncbi:MAG: ABC transporter ATP-binding protein [Deltaproteobacteria bacterium]|nr:ABC transporter ATP-binding protein [Deltaproteobacteria bacterium]MBW2130280.1 ABC transporter ATP-binding protein [Deltaproteobacteria bacterium]MBW2302301.1 ABC transporter ATP-binding protein [Deltaproteobacteria bacterium]
MAIRKILHNFLPLKPYFSENRGALILGLASLVAVDFLQLLIPLVIKKAIDTLTAGTASTRLLLHFGGMIAVIALLMAFLRYLWRYLLIGLSRRIEEGLRNTLFSHLLTLSQSFYQRTKTGDVMARAINDINAVRMATGMGLVALTDGLVLGMAAIGFMLHISPLLTLISLIPAPVIILVTRGLTRRMSTGFERVQKTFGDLTEGVREAFSGIRVIKAYSREKWQYRKIRETGDRYVSENMKLARTYALFFPMMMIFTNLGLAIVIGLGGGLTILGRISTGDFVAFISYLNLLTWPMMALGWVANLLQRGSASMRRINGILNEEPEIRDIGAIRKSGAIKGQIEFRGLSFRYPGQKEDALREIHLMIPAGRTIAMVGRVGSGKTTLFHLLARLYDVPPGTLFLDGKDIRDIPLKVLRGSIGFATQEAFVFSDTVRNNVLFGRKGVSDRELESALRTAQVLEEFQALEQGLDTLLGERGITLSGGQKQRLTIARAVLGDPPILILDDALSMVDTRTEERILSEILGKRKGKTTLLVSHRLSTIGRADRIVVFHQGRIIEEGDHETLLRRGEEYARLYERQQLARELEE